MVVAPRHIDVAVIDNSRHDVDVFFKTADELTVNAAQTSKPGSVSTELKSRASINEWLFSAKLWTQ